MATIQQRGNTYQITVSVGADHTGKRLRESVTFTPSETTPAKIKKEVAAFAAEFEKRVKEGKYISADKITFCNFCDKWEEDYARDNLSVKVLEDYKALLKKHIFPSIGNMKLSKITALHLQEIYRDMRDKGYKPGTIRKMHTILSGILTRAFKWGLVSENVAQRCDLPKMPKTQSEKCFTLEQAERFQEILWEPMRFEIKAHDRVSEIGNEFHVNGYQQTHEIPLQFRVFYTLALQSGCRRNELLALQWKDINFDDCEITISKAISKTQGQGQIVKAPKSEAGNRTIALQPECFEMLSMWKKEQKELSMSLGSKWTGERGRSFDKNHIFIQLDSGKLMDADTLGHKFKEILAAYNRNCKNEEDKLPEITLHGLRHTYATLAISHGVDVRTVAYNLGHADASVTLRTYTHALKTANRSAADVMERLLKVKVSG